MEKIRVMLPVDNGGRPDFEFMDGYIREVMAAKRKQYSDYIATNSFTFRD